MSERLTYLPLSLTQMRTLRPFLSGTFRGTFEVAVKTLKSDRDPSCASGNGSDGGDADSARAAKARKEFHSETQILMQLHHPHLVQVRCHFHATFTILLKRKRVKWTIIFVFNDDQGSFETLHNFESSHIFFSLGPGLWHLH